MPYVPLTAVDLQPNKPARATSFALRVHNNFEDHEKRLVSLAEPVRSLGGSRVFPNDMAQDFFGRIVAKSNDLGPREVFDARDVEIDGTNQSSITYSCRVKCRVDWPAISVTPQIYNVTTAAVVGTGAACSGVREDYTGTSQTQSFSFTAATGVNLYRLRFVLNRVGGTTWMEGYVDAVVV